MSTIHRFGFAMMLTAIAIGILGMPDVPGGYEVLVELFFFLGIMCLL